MKRTRLPALITFIEDFSTSCVARGIFFLTLQRMGFSRKQNLLLAIIWGGMYVAGASVSHRMSRLLGERRLLTAVFVGQATLHLTQFIWPSEWSVYPYMGLLAFLCGLKWPIIESYVSAGLGPKQTSRAIGLFSLCWSGAIPLAMLVTGPLIELSPRALFAVPVTVSVMSLLLSRLLPAQPSHLPIDHPERPSPDLVRRIRPMVSASRWLMLANVASIWILGALMPDVFDRMGFKVAAPALAGVMDLARFCAFALLLFWIGWHYRPSLLILSLVAMPASVFAILFGPNLGWVLAGEVVFGLTAAFLYKSALYYAMVLGNASVGASGKHESLVGLAFIIGPVSGLAGVSLSGVFGSDVGGMLLGIGPLFALTSVAAIRAIKPLVSTRQNE